MQLDILLYSPKNIELPWHYNHILQAFLYNTIDVELSEFLHNEGYGNARKFKLFVFSSLYGKFVIDRDKNTIIFCNKVKLHVSSPFDNFCESFATGLFRNSVEIGKNRLSVERITVDRQEVRKEVIKVRTLSPVVAYSTFIKPDNGKKYTCYYEPNQEEFKRIVAENIRKKFYALTGLQVEDGFDFKIEPIGHHNLHPLKYKDFIIKGYSGDFILKGSKQFLQLAVDSGIGSKNSQGFGFIKIVE